MARCMAAGSVGLNFRAHAMPRSAGRVATQPLAHPSGHRQCEGCRDPPHLPRLSSSRTPIAMHTQYLAAPPRQAVDKTRSLREPQASSRSSPSQVSCAHTSAIAAKNGHLTCHVSKVNHAAARACSPLHTRVCRDSLWNLPALPRPWRTSQCFDPETSPRQKTLSSVSLAVTGKRERSSQEDYRLRRMPNLGANAASCFWMKFLPCFASAAHVSTSRDLEHP